MYMASIEESIRDILVTPIGSRVCLPEYGSRLHELADKRVDAAFKADLTRYVFEALNKWETRAKPARIKNLRQYGDKLYFEIELENGDSVSIGGGS